MAGLTRVTAVRGEWRKLRHTFRVGAGKCRFYFLFCH